jgi:hypothetical protein
MIGLDRKTLHRWGRAVLGARGALSRRGRRSHRATALDGFMIKADDPARCWKALNRLGDSRAMERRLAGRMIEAHPLPFFDPKERPE